FFRHGWDSSARDLEEAAPVILSLERELPQASGAGGATGSRVRMWWNAQNVGASLLDDARFRGERPMPGGWNPKQTACFLTSFTKYYFIIDRLPRDDLAMSALAPFQPS